MTQEPNPFGPYIAPNPRGRRLVISDIHGCARTFNTLLGTIGLSPQDQLFLLGDYIDRGPDSGAVLSKILQLMGRGYQIYPLRGNHEQYLLEAAEYYSPQDLRRYVLEVNECTGVVDEEGKIKPLFRQFLESLPFFYVLDDFYLVHAGFNFKGQAPFQDYRSMLEIRNFWADGSQTANRRIVHGHQVTDLAEIEASLRKNATVIPLDNGCCFAKMAAEYKRLNHVIVGNLCCLDLDTLELTIQPNVEFAFEASA
jgi:serine/threonine protein phosphatase 1